MLLNHRVRPPLTEQRAPYEDYVTRLPRGAGYQGGGRGKIEDDERKASEPAEPPTRCVTKTARHEVTSVQIRVRVGKTTKVEPPHRNAQTPMEREFVDPRLLAPPNPSSRITTLLRVLS